jgi:hypothetical protein
MTGAEIYQHAVMAHPGMPERFIFISGDTSNAATRTFLAEAGRPLLAKPFTAAELFEIIAGVIS